MRFKAFWPGDPCRLPACDFKLCKSKSPTVCKSTRLCQYTATWRWSTRPYSRSYQNNDNDTLFARGSKTRECAFCIQKQGFHSYFLEVHACRYWAKSTKCTYVLKQHKIMKQRLHFPIFFSTFLWWMPICVNSSPDRRHLSASRDAIAKFLASFKIWGIFEHSFSKYKPRYNDINNRYYLLYLHHLIDSSWVTVRRKRKKRNCRQKTEKLKHLKTELASWKRWIDGHN